MLAKAGDFLSGFTVGCIFFGICGVALGLGSFGLLYFVEMVRFAVGQ